VTPTDVFTLTGAAGVVIRITRIAISGSRTASGNSDFVLLKRSTANTLGISSAPAIVPSDSLNAAPSGVVRAYTANPTLGTLVGNIAAFKLWITGVSTSGIAPFIFNLGTRFATAMILRGAAEVFAINMNAVSIAGNSMNFFIEWTEEQAP
jgi:hypothetical protein